MTSNTKIAPDVKPQPKPAEASLPVATPESGGPKGPEPTRYGDWELKGKCVDF